MFLLKDQYNTSTFYALKLLENLLQSDVVVSRLALSFRLVRQKDQGAWEQDYTDYHSKGVWYPPPLPLNGLARMLEAIVLLECYFPQMN